MDFGNELQNWNVNCDDLRGKSMFEDIDVKFQAEMCLKFDVDFYENMFELHFRTF